MVIRELVQVRLGIAVHNEPGVVCPSKPHHGHRGVREVSLRRPQIVYVCVAVGGERLFLFAEVCGAVGGYRESKAVIVADDVSGQNTAPGHAVHADPRVIHRLVLTQNVVREDDGADAVIMPHRVNLGVFGRAEAIGCESVVFRILAKRFENVVGECVCRVTVSALGDICTRGNGEIARRFHRDRRVATRVPTAYPFHISVTAAAVDEHHCGNGRFGRCALGKSEIRKDARLLAVIIQAVKADRLNVGVLRIHLALGEGMHGVVHLLTLGDLHCSENFLSLLGNRLIALVAVGAVFIVRKECVQPLAFFIGQGVAVEVIYRLHNLLGGAASPCVEIAVNRLIHGTVAVFIDIDISGCGEGDIFLDRNA